jgi:hypothetical protein
VVEMRGRLLTHEEVKVVEVRPFVEMLIDANGNTPLNDTAFNYTVNQQGDHKILFKFIFKYPDRLSI